MRQPEPRRHQVARPAITAPRTSIINSEPGLVRAADAMEAEMLASAFAVSQRALMTQ
jgi:hypothetical protein